MRWAILVLVIAACGRIKFDDRNDGTITRCSYRAVATGRIHTCAIDTDGGVWCWGANYRRQVAPDSVVENILVPTRVVLPAAAIQIAAGNASSCALLADASVWCWGDNAREELGVDPTALPQGGPVAIALGDTATELAVGAHHACVRRTQDSAVMCWGDNDAGQLGRAVGGHFPPALVANTAGAQQVSTGHKHTCYLDSAGAPFCFGRNRDAQLGYIGADSSTPVAITGLGPVRTIEPGGSFTCALETSGDVQCWGTNSDGQLGRFNYVDDPMVGAMTVANAIDVRTGAVGACALLDSKATVCWGISNNGAASASPRPFLADTDALSFGFGHGCGLVGAEVRCWGLNIEGELGRGTRALTAAETPVALGAAVQHLAVGSRHACASTAAGLFCWGINDHGELGIGGTTTAVTPTLVTTGLSTVDGITTSMARTCAWGGGLGRCWGQNRNGETGNGMLTALVATPAPFGTVTNISMMATGELSTCALAGAQVLCVGDNVHGELGDGTTANSSTPVAVATLTAPTKISLGSNHACAIDAGALKCWGDNVQGQIGDNTTVDQPTPVTIVVPGAGNVTDVAAGPRSTCAVRGGTVSCWGRNLAGNLGQGDLTDRRTPTAVTLPGPAISLATSGQVTGQNVVCATLATGNVFCWGENNRGQLGTGEFVRSLVPIEIARLGGANEIAVGPNGSCKASGGNVSCWGIHMLLANGDASNLAAQPPVCER